MKKQIICFIVSVTAFLLYLAMPYIQGRTNSIWIVPPLFPAAVVPLVAMFLGFVILFAFTIRAGLTKRNIGATASMFIISLTLFLVSFKVPTDDLFQRGFNDYARTVLTADQWRQIASFAQSHWKPGVRFWGPYVHDSDANDALLPAFNAATQIQRLGTAYSIFTDTNQTDIFWGSALTGHRCVIVFSGPPIPCDECPKRTFFTNDIATSGED